MFKLVFLLFGKPKTQVLYNMNMHNAALIKKKKTRYFKKSLLYVYILCNVRAI